MLTEMDAIGTTHIHLAAVIMTGQILRPMQIAALAVEVTVTSHLASANPTATDSTHTARQERASRLRVFALKAQVNAFGDLRMNTTCVH